MKYNQPYGVSDPNAPYVNGNPSTGTMGSIPPAGSIEFPQREIVNVIAAAGLTPSDGDLAQLAKSIQGGRLTYGPDLGSLSDFHLQMSPPVLSYIDGMVIRFRANRDAPGACTLRLDALGQRPLVKRSGATIQAYDFIAGDMLECIYDAISVRFMVIGLMAVSLLRAPLDYYVNFASGVDDYTKGLTPATAFKTISFAIGMALTFNQNGYDVSIHCADGVSTDKVYGPPINGSGFIKIYGNVSNPDACQITSSAGSCFVLAGPYQISGFSLAAPNVLSGDATCCIWAVGNGTIYAYALNFRGTSNGLLTASGGSLVCVGPFIVKSGCTASHFMGTDGGSCGSQDPGWPVVTFQGPATFQYGFATAGRGGVTTALYSALNGFSNVLGPKYSASGNGVIFTYGASTSALPGNVAGSLSTGGQYV